MYIYIIDWILICFLGILFGYHKKYNKVFLVGSFFIMALTIGFRSVSVGEDTRMYLSIAEASQNLSFREIIQEFPKSTWSIDIHGLHNKIETVYLLYNKIIMFLTGNVQAVLIITAIISCLGFGKFILDNSSDIFLSTYIFLCEFFFMSSFNLMRQILAMSIAINSYTCIKKKKYKSALILIFISSLIHQSSLIYLLLFWLCKIENKKNAIKYIFIGAIILTQITPILGKIAMRFSPYYASYLQVSYWSASANGIVVLWIIETIMIILLYFNGMRNRDEFVIISCTILYLAVEIIGLKFTAISRVALYFRVFIVLLFPSFKRCFKKNDKLYYIIIICGILALFYFRTAMSDTRIYSSFFSV